MQDFVHQQYGSGVEAGFQGLGVQGLGVWGLGFKGLGLWLGFGV